MQSNSSIYQMLRSVYIGQSVSIVLSGLCSKTQLLSLSELEREFILNCTIEAKVTKTDEFGANLHIKALQHTIHVSPSLFSSKVHLTFKRSKKVHFTYSDLEMIRSSTFVSDNQRYNIIKRVVLTSTKCDHVKVSNTAPVVLQRKPSVQNQNVVRVVLKRYNPPQPSAVRTTESELNLSVSLINAEASTTCGESTVIIKNEETKCSITANHKTNDTHHSTAVQTKRREFDAAIRVTTKQQRIEVEMKESATVSNMPTNTTTRRSHLIKFNSCEVGDSIMFMLRGLYSASKMEALSQYEQSLLIDRSAAAVVLMKDETGVVIQISGLGVLLSLSPNQYVSHVDLRSVGSQHVHMTENDLIGLRVSVDQTQCKKYSALMKLCQQSSLYVQQDSVSNEACDVSNDGDGDVKDDASQNGEEQCESDVNIILTDDASHTKSTGKQEHRYVAAVKNDNISNVAFESEPHIVVGRKRQVISLYDRTYRNSVNNAVLVTEDSDGESVEVGEECK